MPNTDESPHHSAKQVRNDAGQWVSGDSFDGKLAALKSHIGGLLPDGFEGKLEALKSHLARSYPVASLDAAAAKVGYDQASRTVADTGNAMAKMGRALGNAFGARNTDVMPTNQDAALIAGLAMTGGGFGSLASKAVSGRALEDVAASNGLRSSPVEAGSGPVSARVYRGSPNVERWPSGKEAFWASDSPEVANGYASPRFGNDHGEGQVIPADVTFRNPMVIDAAGADYASLPGEFSNPYAAQSAAAERGHDGLVIRNVQDNGPLATTYAAIKPGTVHSATTGETLFSNPKEAAPLGLALSQDHPLSRFAQGRAGLKELQGQTDAAKARLVDVLQNVQAYKPGMTAEDVTSAIDALKSGQTDAIEPQLRNLLQAHKAPEALDAYRNMENARASAIDNTVAKWPFANDEKLAVNPKEAAPVGALAAQGQQPVNALATDAASRMARARNMGFDPDKTFYHGSQSGNIDAFDLGRAETGWRGKAVHVSEDPNQAAMYGSAGRDFPGAVYPLNLRLKNVADYSAPLPPGALTADELAKVKADWSAAIDKVGGVTPEMVSHTLGANATVDVLKRLGHDAFKDGTHYGVFDPANIRSTNAAFDPSMSDSANLLAVNPPEAAAAGTVGMDQRSNDPFDTALAALHSFFNQPKASP